MKTIYLAGGCFWGVEAYFCQLKGVVDVSVGYINGNSNKPNYNDLKNGLLTHAEAIKLTYDEKVISLETILKHMFRFVDPTSINKQGDDVGIQYRSGIYYDDISDKKVIDEFLKQLALKYDKPIVVEVDANKGYYLAEEYHQKYLQKNPNGYCHVDLSLILEDEKK